MILAVILIILAYCTAFIRWYNSLKDVQNYLKHLEHPELDNKTKTTDVNSRNDCISDRLKYAGVCLYVTNPYLCFVLLLLLKSNFARSYLIREKKK